MSIVKSHLCLAGPISYSHLHQCLSLMFGSGGATVEQDKRRTKLWETCRDIHSLYPWVSSLHFPEVSIIMPVDERSEAHMQRCDKFLLPTLWHISFGMGFGRGGKGTCRWSAWPVSLSCVSSPISLHLSFQRGNFPLVSKPNFSKTPCVSSRSSPCVRPVEGTVSN